MLGAGLARTKYVDLPINIFAGVSLDFPDKNMNTPLHYAAKYGHVELCKHLIQLGSSPAQRNTDGATAYDVTENHVVRQYLLPLQLQAERQMNDYSGNFVEPPPQNTAYGNTIQHSGYNIPPPPQSPSLSSAATVPAPPIPYGNSYTPPPPAIHHSTMKIDQPKHQSSTQILSHVHNYPPATVSSATPATASVTAAAPTAVSPAFAPPPQPLEPYVPVKIPTIPTNTSGRLIQPGNQ